MKRFNPLVIVAIAIAFFVALDDALAAPTPTTQIGSPFLPNQCVATNGQGQLITYSCSVPYQGPCDILASASTPCIAAHSMTRKMLSTYTGSAFQIERISDSTTLNIGFNSDGTVNTSGIASFCAATVCKVSELYDQLGTPSVGNNLPQATAANQAPLAWVQPMVGTAVPVLSMTASHNTPIYYRNRLATVSMPTGANPITEIMVANTFAYATCCGTYGDVETNVTGSHLAGEMFALALSTGALGTTGSGNGPWPGVDLEQGVYMYGATPSAQFATIVGKLASASPIFTVEAADATQGALTTVQSGALPVGYTMNMEGGLSIGEGGDGSPAAINFEEGLIVSAATSPTVDAAVQANIAGYYNRFVNGYNLINWSYPNILPNSNAFGAWTSVGTFTPHATLGPSGLVNGWKYTTTGNNQYFHQSISGGTTASQIYRCGIYVEAGSLGIGSQSVLARFDDAVAGGTNNVFALFNLSGAGSMSSSGGTGGTGASAQAGIWRITGTDWFFIWIQGSITQTDGECTFGNFGNGAGTLYFANAAGMAVQ